MHACTWRLTAVVLSCRLKGRLPSFSPPVTVICPALIRDRVQIIHGFKPDYDAWAARGYDVVRTIKDRYAACIVVLATRQGRSPRCHRRRLRGLRRGSL